MGVGNGGVGVNAGIGGAGINAGIGANGAGVGVGNGNTGAGAGVGTNGGTTGGTMASGGNGGGAMANAGGGSNQNVLEFSVDALEGTPVYGAGNSQLGTIDRLVRSNNAYVVMQIDTGWFSSGGTAVVPLQRFTWANGQLTLPGVTQDSVQNYNPYGGVYGGFWNSGYSEINPDYYANVGSIYGYNG